MGFERHSIAEMVGNPEDTSVTGSSFQQKAKRYRDACIKDATASTKELWGNKITTEQLYALVTSDSRDSKILDKNLGSFFEQYLKGVKLVFILRDGRSCILSKQKCDGHPLSVGAEKWMFSVYVYKFLMGRMQSFHTLHFEKLLASPSTELIKVCDFLNISFDEAMLSDTQNDEMHPRYQSTAIHTEPMEIPTLPKSIVDLIRGDLCEAGHEDPQ